MSSSGAKLNITANAVADFSFARNADSPPANSGKTIRFTLCPSKIRIHPLTSEQTESAAAVNDCCGASQIFTHLYLRTLLT
jgi:hypothetical protein